MATGSFVADAGLDAPLKVTPEAGEKDAELTDNAIGRRRDDVVAVDGAGEASDELPDASELLPGELCAGDDRQ